MGPDSYLGPLPDWLARIAARLVSEGIFQTPPEQVIVNEYEPGQGIAAHIDCEPCFGDVIASLSSGSACIMEFTDTRSGEVIEHYLEPRSRLILSGESRFNWKHGIPARKSDIINGITRPRGRRLSLTFRNVIRMH